MLNLLLLFAHEFHYSLLEFQFIATLSTSWQISSVDNLIADYRNYFNNKKQNECETQG